MIKVSDHVEDYYSILMDERVKIATLEKRLCQADKEVVWATKKNN